MTAEPPAPDHDAHRPLDDDPAAMPRWVPIAIGVVLVTLAALAVVTGMRYRDQTLVRIVRPASRGSRPAAPAPPGEPEPGASLMFPGDASNVPPARASVGGSAAGIRGNRTGVSAAVPLWARRGMILKVTPPEAVVYVNDVAIGQASQFDSDEKEYDFAAQGSYMVRLVAPGYRERLYVVTAGENAKAEVARIEVKLEKE